MLDVRQSRQRRIGEVVQTALEQMSGGQPARRPQVGRHATEVYPAKLDPRNVHHRHAAGSNMPLA